MKASKNICLLAIFILFSVFVSGCAETQNKTTMENNPSVPSSEVNTVSAVGQAGSSSSAQSAQSQAPESTESFMGTWTITKPIASNTGGSTYDADTIKQLIGKQLTFSKEKATCFGEDISNMDQTVSNPSYKKETLTDDELYQKFRVSFKMLGITADSLTQISADDGNNGCTFFVVDHDTLLIEGGGDFFQLKRSN